MANVNKIENVKCVYCGRVYKYGGSNASIRSHIRQNHGKSCVKDTDWTLTKEKPIPVMRKRKSGWNPMCIHCGKFCDTYNSMVYHMKRTHSVKGMRKDIDWRYGKEGTSTHLTNTSPKTGNAFMNKRIPQAVTPDIQYMDIPIVIRVPISISLGQVQIKQIEE